MKMSPLLLLLLPFLLNMFITTLLISPIISQRIIYSINHLKQNNNHNNEPLIIMKTKLFKMNDNNDMNDKKYYNVDNQIMNVTNNDNINGDTIINKRPKRFVIQRMPKTPKHYHHHRMNNNQDDNNFNNNNKSMNNSNLVVDNEKFRNISSVLASLLDHYDHNQRPGYGGPPAVITTNLEIRSMGPISELDMEYSLDCYFRQKWKDERLRFTGNAEFLSLNIKMLDKIWKPDTYFHTGKASHLHMITTPNKFLRIFKDGLVLYSMRLTIKSLCPMDLHSFPMDKQSCPLILGSYGFPSDQLVYSWDKKPVTFNQKDFTLSQFDIVKTIYRNGTFTFKRGNHSMLQVNFNLRRHVGYFLIQIYVPCSLIVVLSWVSFWINREATSDRVGLGVTAVLTLSTFGLDSRSDLPRVSYATALDWYTVMCFLFVVFTLLEFAGVHYFTKVGTGEVPVIEIDDDWIKNSDSDYSDVGDHSNETNYNTLNRRKIMNRQNYCQYRHQRPRQRNKILSKRNSRSKRIKRTKKIWHDGYNNNNNNEQSINKRFTNYYKSYAINDLMDKHYDYDNIVVDKQREFNQFRHFPQSLENVSDIVSPPSTMNVHHMPHCPRYNQHRHHQDIDWNSPATATSYSFLPNLINDYNNNNDDENISNTIAALKLNSSWPQLGLNVENDHHHHHNVNINQLFENYSNEFINNLNNYNNNTDDTFFNDENDNNIEKDDNDNDDNDDDDISEIESYNINDNADNNDNNDDFGTCEYISLWLWTKLIHPFAQCCIQFWYCFTANEQFKKEMIKRRTKSQNMCAVNSVSMIDKVSRILFPFVFIMLNMAYWTFYISERNSDFIQWEQ